MFQESKGKEEAYLVKRTLAGDDEAFASLVNLYKNRIYQFIYRKIPIKSDVEDLTQEVFVKVYKSLRRFDLKRNFSTWIFTIANNQCIDYLRKKRLQAVSLDVPLFPGSAGKEVHLEIPDIENEPAQVYERTAEQEAILHAIEQLPEQYSLVLKLRHLKGYSYDEIGGLLDLPLGTIKSRIYRARRELKELLFGKKGGEEDGVSRCL